MSSIFTLLLLGGVLTESVNSIGCTGDGFDIVENVADSYAMGNVIQVTFSHTPQAESGEGIHIYSSDTCTSLTPPDNIPNYGSWFSKTTMQPSPLDDGEANINGISLSRRGTYLAISRPDNRGQISRIQIYQWLVDDSTWAKFGGVITVELDITYATLEVQESSSTVTPSVLLLIGYYKGEEDGEPLSVYTYEITGNLPGPLESHIKKTEIMLNGVSQISMIPGPQNSRLDRKFKLSLEKDHRLRVSSRVYNISNCIYNRTTGEWNVSVNDIRNPCRPLSVLKPGEIGNLPNKTAIRSHGIYETGTRETLLLQMTDGKVEIFERSVWGNQSRVWVHYQTLVNIDYTGSFKINPTLSEDGETLVVSTWSANHTQIHRYQRSLRSKFTPVYFEACQFITFRVSVKHALEHCNFTQKEEKDGSKSYTAEFLTRVAGSEYSPARWITLHEKKSTWAIQMVNSERSSVIIVGVLFMMTLLVFTYFLFKVKRVSCKSTSRGKCCKICPSLYTVEIRERD